MDTICVHSHVTHNSLKSINPHTHTQEHTPMYCTSLHTWCAVYCHMLFLLHHTAAVRLRKVGWWWWGGAQSQGEWRRSGMLAQRALSSILGSVGHSGPAWGCFWQQLLQQIIEQQMKTNDMIAVRVPAVNPLSRWFPFKAIDQLYNLSSWPGN